MAKPTGVPRNTRLLFFSRMKSNFSAWISENQEKAAMPYNGGSMKELQYFFSFLYFVQSSLYP